jgi:hypothetical protein
MLKNHVLANVHNGYRVEWDVNTSVHDGAKTAKLYHVDNAKQLFHKGYQRLLIKKQGGKTAPEER